MPEALNAVIYARYSSDRQTEQSIEGQLRECYAFAKANDIAVIDTYIDRAISGKTDNRPAFQKMIEDSAKRQFQAVIVYRLDRFTRNRYDSAIYKARLKKNGVKVLSAMENLNGSPESIIMESLLEGMAEYYSVELSQKITRGMRENALKGKALGGQRVLGYKVNSDCYFEIDETTAPVVVDIFKLYSSGKTVKEICDILNARGVKTARGGAFNKNSLHTILTNKKYIGIYKTKYGEIVGGIPAIIDKELFEMVALRMEQNKKAPARAKAEINYLLSTKLFCGKCRSAMVGESGTSKTGKKYYYYACVKKKREKACDKSNVKKDWIEDLVIQRTVTDILKDDVIEKIAERLVELQKAEAAESGTMLYLQNSLAEIQVSIKNIMTAIEKGIITESTKTRLTELEDEKRNVEIEIAKESIARRIISREQIIYWISSFKDGDITSEKYRQQLIDTFVHAVFVYDDKIVITYNYSGENNTATISDLDLSSPPNFRNPPRDRWVMGGDFLLFKEKEQDHASADGRNSHESTDHRSAAFSGSGHRVLSDPHQPGEQAVTPAAQKVTPALVAMTSVGVFACASGRVIVGISVKARERRHFFSLSPRSKRNFALFSGTSTGYSPVKQPVQKPSPHSASFVTLSVLRYPRESTPMICAISGIVWLHAMRFSRESTSVPK